MGHLMLIRGGRGLTPAASNPTGVQSELVTNVRRRPRDTGQQPVVPMYDREQEPAPETVFVPLTPLEWSLIHQALAERGQGNSLRVGSQAHADLAAKVRRMVRSRLDRPSTLPADDCPPGGLPRPGA